jgi:ribosome-associated protein
MGGASKVPSKKVPSKKTAAKKTTAATKSPAVKAAKKTAPAKAAVKVAAKSAVKSAVNKPAAKPVDPSAVPNWLAAARSADSKKATNLRVIDLREITSFADFFFICSASNQRQVQAIANDIEDELKKQGERPTAVEGFSNAEWVLMDYGDLVVHIFSEQARAYYDLDRLWRDGKQVPLSL